MSTEREQVEALARVITGAMRNGLWALSTPRDFAEAIVKSTLLPEVKAEAWDEGYDAGHQDARAVQQTYPSPTANPYPGDSC